MAAGVSRGVYAGMGMGICRIYPAGPFPMPGIPVLGDHHPADGYGSAAGLSGDESRHAARHARARVLEFAPLVTARLQVDARGAPPSLITRKAPVRAAMALARRARARLGRETAGGSEQSANTGKCRVFTVPAVYTGIYPSR